MQINKKNFLLCKRAGVLFFSLQPISSYPAGSWAPKIAARRFSDQKSLFLVYMQLQCHFGTDFVFSLDERFVSIPIGCQCKILQSYKVHRWHAVPYLPRDVHEQSQFVPGLARISSSHKPPKKPGRCHKVLGLPHKEICPKKTILLVKVHCESCAAQACLLQKFGCYKDV